jgi:hypothetical protein
MFQEKWVLARLNLIKRPDCYLVKSIIGFGWSPKAVEQFCITNQRVALPGSLDKPPFASVGLVWRPCALL